MKLSYNNKWVKILLHTTVWVLVFSLPYLLRHSYDNAGLAKLHPPPPFTIFTVFMDLTWVALFYLNAALFVPVFINNRKYLLYALVQLASFFGVMLVHWFLFTFMIPPGGRKFDFRVILFIDFNIALFLLVIAASAAYRMTSDKIKADNIEKEKQKENMKTELSFLRSQISPHFMFNVLNNIVALARLKSEKLEPTIFKLSSLMRYMLYQSDEKKVPLQKEVEYLKSYIDLQQLRFGEKVTINLSVNITDDQIEIEPMLLIPFVENAFKHGTGYIAQPQIDIELSETAHALQFSVKNKFSSNQNEPKDDTSGIGLVNVERRLALLYPQAHELHILQQDGWFNVSLQLKLHNATMYRN
jgi:sensor histidine kinase YesM